MKYNRICLFLPTYHRPERLERFVKTAVAKAEDYNRLRFAFCVNESDKETLSCLDKLDVPVEHDTILENTDQPNLAYYYNLLYEKTRFNDADTIVSMLGDDMFFVTGGWDAAILNVFNREKGDAIVWCNDNFIGKGDLAVNLFVSRKVVQATDKPFMCKRFHAEMIDVVWTNVAMITGLACYLEDVVIQHEHEMKITDPKERDLTCRRLEPLRQLANTDEGRKYAWSYATLCAANLIKNGIGEWNTL